VKFPGQSRVIHRTASGDMSTLDAAAWVLACGFHDCISLAEPQASRVAHGMFIGRNGPQPKEKCTMATWRKHTSATLFAAAGIALAGGGLVQPAIASAERSWDLEIYDNCIDGGYTIQTCCVLSGGDYDPDAVTCYAPPAEKVQTEPEKPTINLPGTITLPGKAARIP
jgi:hypothetical protein